MNFPLTSVLALYGVLFMACAQEPLDCTIAHVGSFQDEIGPEELYFILRTDSSQEEYTPSLGLRVRFRVRWPDPCTYQLFDKEIVEGTPARMPSSSDTLTVHITAVDPSSFTYDARANYASWVLTGRQQLR